MAAYNFDGAFRNLNNSLANLGKQSESAWLRERQAEAGQDLLSGNFVGAASKLTALGDVSSAAALMQLQQKSDERRLGQEATTNLGTALRGLGGNYSSPASSDSALAPSLISNESGGNWQAQNDAVGAGGNVGHFGRGQFGVARLQEAANAGAIPQGTTPQQFMKSPELQKRAEQWHVGDIDANIRANGFDRLIGQRINGVPITIDGLRAVAHLGGVNGMKKFVETQGGYNPSDQNGTSLFDYFSRHGGTRSAAADVPAPGGANASMETGQDGFAIPAGGGSPMSGRTFAQITNGMSAPTLRPAFEAEGLGQGWMGTALGQGQPSNQRPLGLAQLGSNVQPFPPSRPADIDASDLPAPGASPAMAKVPVAPAQYPDADPNSPDAGARLAQVASEEARQGQRPGGVQFAQADIPAPGASEAIGTLPPSAVGSVASAAAVAQPAGGGPAEAATPVPSRELPRPTNAQEARDYRETRAMESRQGKISALATALANPNLPANARAIGEIFLKDALEQSKAPESAKEFMYARGMGWTKAKNLAEYSAETEKAKKTTADESVEERQAAAARAGLRPGDAGYQGYLLTGKMPREDMGPLTATDKKAILEADELVLSNRTAIDSLKQAKELSAKAYEGPTAGLRGAVTGNLGSDAGKATMEYNNLVTANALSQLKATFGAAPTEGERKILLEIQGSANLPHDVRVKILDRGIAMAEKRMAFNEQRARELRGGDYYKSPEKRSQAGGGQPAATPSGDQPQRQAGQPVRVTSPADAYRLPKGTPIILPDGRVGEVP